MAVVKKTTIGAGATLAALGGLTGYAISSSGDEATTATATREPVEVRTETIHRTVHVVKHEKPRHPKPNGRESAAAAAGPVPAAAAAPRAVPVAAPPRPAPARVVSSPAPVRHVTTRSSGSGSGEHEREHEVEHENE